MEFEKISLLAEHYKNTYNFQKENLKKRDRYFLLSLISMGLMLFIIYTPIEAFNLISEFIKSKFSLKSNINLLFIQSFLWFSTLSFVIKYFQSVIFIERQYSYLHKIEELISPIYEDKTFNREGKSYLNDYPKFLNWAGFLYTLFFPIILLSVSSIKIITEFISFSVNEPLIYFDLFVFIFMLISIILYQFEMHIKNNKKKT